MEASVTKGRQRPAFRSKQIFFARRWQGGPEHDVFGAALFVFKTAGMRR